MKPRKCEVSISVNRQDCSPPPRFQMKPEILEAIAQTFRRAAQALREGEHGEIRCEGRWAWVGIDRGGTIDEKTGLPMIDRIWISKKPSEGFSPGATGVRKKRGKPYSHEQGYE